MPSIGYPYRQRQYRNLSGVQLEKLLQRELLGTFQDKPLNGEIFFFTL